MESADGAAAEGGRRAADGDAAGVRPDAPSGTEAAAGVDRSHVPRPRTTPVRARRRPVRERRDPVRSRTSAIRERRRPVRARRRPVRERTFPIAHGPATALDAQERAAVTAGGAFYVAVGTAGPYVWVDGAARSALGWVVMAAVVLVGCAVGAWLIVLSGRAMRRGHRFRPAVLGAFGGMSIAQPVLLLVLLGP